MVQQMERGRTGEVRQCGERGMDVKRKGMGERVGERRRGREGIMAKGKMKRGSRDSGSSRERG